ncbi:MAG: DUF1987 domain-containing protein [Bacteroidota bacterium]
MSVLKIPPTKDTPAIYFDPEKGIFKMFGRSLPENSLKFWTPVIKEIERGSLPERLDIRIKMEYYNTSSSKCVFDLLRLFKSFQDQGIRIAIRWYYDQYDEDMLEAGEDYKALLNLPLRFIEVKANKLQKSA